MMCRWVMSREPPGLCDCSPRLAPQVDIDEATPNVLRKLLGVANGGVNAVRVTLCERAPGGCLSLLCPSHMLGLSSGEWVFPTLSHVRRRKR